jgi:hypothetical protein
MTIRIDLSGDGVNAPGETEGTQVKSLEIMAHDGRPSRSRFASGLPGQYTSHCMVHEITTMDSMKCRCDADALQLQCKSIANCNCNADEANLDRAGAVVDWLVNYLVVSFGGTTIGGIPVCGHSTESPHPRPWTGRTAVPGLPAGRSPGSRAGVHDNALGGFGRARRRLVTLA